MDDDVLARDYLRLLRRGSVMRKLAPVRHREWRRALRARAAADAIRIRTGSRPAESEVWAVLPDWSLTQSERERLAQRLAWLRED
ncbi:MAG TPA: hypothetical protein VGL76_08545 [Gaiellaceae bacterium]|jgi:hypothetical protein